MANAERTFIMVKPDGVQRGLVGDIVKRFEQRGFKLVAMKFMQVSGEQFVTDLNIPAVVVHQLVIFQGSKEHLEQHYIDLKEKPFYAGLVSFMSSGPVVPMVWEGKNAAKAGRMMMGETDPQVSIGRLWLMFG